MQQSISPAPGKFQALAYITLVSGVLNVIYGLGLTAGVVLSTFGIGLLCAPVTILPTILGVFEILYAVKLLANPPQPPLKPSQAIAILEICCVLLGGVLQAVAGILALVFYNDPEVIDYFNRINGGAA